MPTRSAGEAIERSANGSIARTLNRKPSLLGFVPTACGQAADIAAHMTPPRRRFSSPCRAIMLRCSEIAHRSRRYVTIDSRSDPTSSRCQISRLRIRLRSLMAQAKDVLCGRADSAGGARRNRTDDLLLAKQALSQLSYGPSRYTEASIRGRTRAPDHRYLIPESGGPGKI